MLTIENDTIKFREAGKSIENIWIETIVLYLFEKGAVVWRYVEKVMN